jgi:hypothetical protein
VRRRSHRGIECDPSAAPTSAGPTRCCRKPRVPKGGLPRKELRLSSEPMIAAAGTRAVTVASSLRRPVTELRAAMRHTRIFSPGRDARFGLARSNFDRSRIAALIHSVWMRAVQDPTRKSPRAGRSAVVHPRDAPLIGSYLIFSLATQGNRAPGDQ